MHTGPACRALMSLALGAAALGLAGCSASPGACAGQCRPPYQLQVLFRATTSARTAQAVLARCAASPAVIRVGKLWRDGGSQPAATVFTRDFGKSAKTSALLSCLSASPAVVSAAWPD